MNVPDDLRYTTDHEWVRVEQSPSGSGSGKQSPSGSGEQGSRIRIGITDYAQDALGDVVFVQVPTVGDTFADGASFGEVESTKSVSDIYAPVAGTVVEVNDDLADAPQRLNEDPYGEGWICVLEVADAAAVDGLLDAAAYRALVEA